MTEEQAKQRAKVLGGASIARPYEFEGDEWVEWGVTDTNNKIVPPKNRDSLYFKGYQKSFMEV